MAINTNSCPRSAPLLLPETGRSYYESKRGLAAIILRRSQGQLEWRWEGQNQLMIVISRISLRTQIRYDGFGGHKDGGRSIADLGYGPLTQTNRCAIRYNAEIKDFLPAGKGVKFPL